MTKSDNYDSYYVTDFLNTSSEIKLLYSGVELQHSAVASSQLSLVLSKTGVCICSWLAMIGQRA